jgi:hypothetical protein
LWTAVLLERATFDIEQYNKEKNTYNWFNPATYLCLSQTMTWISNSKCCLFFIVQLFELVVRFDDVGGIVDHLCLNFFL